MKKFTNIIKTLVLLISIIALNEEVKGDCINGNCVIGYGKYVYKTGSEYQGNWKNGKKNGNGVFLWLNGSQYKGLFLNGKADRKGIYTYPDGRKKEMIYCKGHLVRARWISIDYLEEKCRYGRYQSLGIYIGWYKGTRVKGYIPHGRGKMDFKNGSIYIGQWKDGKMHGKGTIKWSNGSFYVGNWDYGKRSGFGIYSWKDGSRYKGQWEENNMTGYGIFYHHDGRVTRGYWREGKCISTKNFVSLK